MRQLAAALGIQDFPFPVEVRKMENREVPNLDLVLDLDLDLDLDAQLV